MTKPQRREETIAKLKECQSDDDSETSHKMADEILVRYLIDIGEWQIAKEYKEIDKWYA